MIESDQSRTFAIDIEGKGLNGNKEGANVLKRCKTESKKTSGKVPHLLSLMYLRDSKDSHLPHDSVCAALQSQICLKLFLKTDEECFSKRTSEKKQDIKKKSTGKPRYFSWFQIFNFQILQFGLLIILPPERQEGEEGGGL